MLGTLTSSGLKSELNLDPAHVGYSGMIAIGSDAGVLNLFTQKSFSTYQPLTSSPILIWSAQNGVKAKVSDAANGIFPTSVPSGYINVLRSVCQNVEYVLQGASTLDITNPLISGAGGMLDLLVQFQILTSGDNSSAKPGLMSLGYVPACRADLLCGYGTQPTVGDISFALRGVQ